MWLYTTNDDNQLLYSLSEYTFTIIIFIYALNIYFCVYLDQIVMTILFDRRVWSFICLSLNTNGATSLTNIFSWYNENQHLLTMHPSIALLDKTRVVYEVMHNIQIRDRLLPELV